MTTPRSIPDGAAPAPAVLALALVACGGATPQGRDDGAAIAEAAAHAQDRVAEYAATRRRPARHIVQPATVQARYTCTDGVVVRVRFDNRTGRATLSRRGYNPAHVAQQTAGSGIHYAGAGWNLRGKGRDAVITSPRGASLSCTAG